MNGEESRSPTGTPRTDFVGDGSVELYGSFTACAGLATARSVVLQRRITKMDYDLTAADFDRHQKQRPNDSGRGGVNEAGALFVFDA